MEWEFTQIKPRDLSLSPHKVNFATNSGDASLNMALLIAEYCRLRSCRWVYPQTRICLLITVSKMHWPTVLFQVSEYSMSEGFCISLTFAFCCSDKFRVRLVLSALLVKGDSPAESCSNPTANNESKKTKRFKVMFYNFNKSFQLVLIVVFFG